MRDEKLSLIASLFPPVSPTWQKWSEAFDLASTDQSIPQEGRDFAAGLLNFSNAFKVLIGVASIFEKPKRKRRRRSTYPH